VKKCWVLFLLSLFLATGCGPSYPIAELPDTLKQLCKEEYGVDVSVQIVGKTLGVHVPLDKLFDSTLQLSPDVGQQLDGVILSTSRVVLSTDVPPDFYVVVAQDKRIPGVELKLTRYVQDIRRLNYQDISRGEYTKRMLFEFGLDLGIFQDEEKSFRIEEIKFEDFLAQQMAFRVKTELDADVTLKSDIQIQTSRGEFASPGRFVITLNAEKTGIGAWGEGGGENERKMLTLSLKEILKVLRGYRFKEYESVQIKTPFLKQSFILNRDVLELYRRKKIALADLLLPNDFNLSPHDADLLLKQ